MIQLRGLACLLALFCFVLPSCGGDSHEKVSEDMISLMSDAATILEGVTDMKSAEAAAPRLEKLGERSEALAKRAEALGDPDPEQEKQLEAKHQAEMEKITQSMMASMMRLSSQPEVIESISQSMAKIK